jgi:hypothetical protein
MKEVVRNSVSQDNNYSLSDIEQSSPRSNVSRVFFYYTFVFYSSVIIFYCTILLPYSIILFHILSSIIFYTFVLYYTISYSIIYDKVIP